MNQLQIVQRKLECEERIFQKKNLEYLAKLVRQIERALLGLEDEFDGYGAASGVPSSYCDADNRVKRRKLIHEITDLPRKEAARKLQKLYFPWIKMETRGVT